MKGPGAILDFEFVGHDRNVGQRPRSFVMAVSWMDLEGTIRDVVETSGLEMVEVVFHDVTPEMTLPMFRPV